MDEKELKPEELESVGGGLDPVIRDLRDQDFTRTEGGEGGEADTLNHYRLDIRAGVPLQQKKTNG